MVKSLMMSRVGGLFPEAEDTVTTKVRVVRLSAACPSFTVTVIVAEPAAPATGVKVRVPVDAGLV